MATREIINLGTQSNDSTGDSPRVAFLKAQNNFLELFNRTDRLFANAPINAKEEGATGDGETDDTSALQTAINLARTSDRPLYIPSGNYKITASLDPCGGSLAGGFVAIYGDFVGKEYRGAPPRRTVIFTELEIPIIKTPKAQQGFLLDWAKYIHLQDLYLYGPGSTHPNQEDEDDTVGVWFDGIFDSAIIRVHVEGCGTGFRFYNFATCKFSELNAQNCYTAVHIKRDLGFPVGNPTTFMDCVSVFEDLHLHNNIKSLEIDNPRDITFLGGSIVPNNNGKAVPVANITNCRDDSVIHFAHMLIENQSGVSAFKIDERGLSLLTIENCNLQSHSTTVPLIDVGGHFDLIKLTGCMTDRVVPPTSTPLIWMHGTPFGGSPEAQTSYMRLDRVVFEDMSPGWHCLVRNDFPNAVCDQDYVPSGYVQIVPDPDLDHAHDGMFGIDGFYNWTADDVVNGKARLYWYPTSESDPEPYLAFSPREAVRGATHLLVFVTCVDNEGSNPPTLSGIIGWGNPGEDWTLVSKTKVGEYTSGDATLSKWAFSVALRDHTFAKTGFTTLQFTDFYTFNDADEAKLTGVERITVWVPQQQAGPAIPFERTTDRNPILLAVAHPKKYDWAQNDFTIDRANLGWIYTGATDSWKPVALERVMKSANHGGGSYSVDFNDARLVRLFLFGDIQFGTSNNKVAGERLLYLIRNSRGDGLQCTITLNASWKRAQPAPVLTLQVGQDAILELWSTIFNDETGIIYRYSSPAN